MLERVRKSLCGLIGHKWELEEPSVGEPPTMACTRCPHAESLFSGRWHRARIEELLGLDR